jgi:hypothetical protein
MKPLGGQFGVQFEPFQPIKSQGTHFEVAEKPKPKQQAAAAAPAAPPAPPKDPNNGPSNPPRKETPAKRKYTMEEMRAVAKGNRIKPSAGSGSSDLTKSRK